MTRAHLNVSMATLDRWSSLGIGPRFFKIGKHRRFRLEDIDGSGNPEASIQNILHWIAANPSSGSGGD